MCIKHNIFIENQPINSNLVQITSIMLCGGSSIPRDLNITGRELKGIHFAMDFLELSNKRVAGDDVDFSNFNLKSKKVIVIGGGDTGSDCIGTSNRLGAKLITQIELLAKPPTNRTKKNPWPNWPMVLRTSSSQEEGCEREWSILTKRFVSNDGIHLSGIEIAEVAWELDAAGKVQMVEKADSLRIIPCDFVFLAIGFLHPLYDGMLKELNIDLDVKANVSAKNYHTNVPGVFTAGDMRRGQSLVVWAISEGREAAVAIDTYLMGNQHSLKSNFESVLNV